MDINKVDKKYREFREKELREKLESAIEIIDIEELKVKLLNKIVSKYVPQLDHVTGSLADWMAKRVENILKEDIGRIVRETVKDEVKDIISEEFDERFRKLISYND